MSDLLTNIGWENAVEAWHLAVLIILLILGFYWEIRKQKSRKVWRTIALLLTFISLYIIYLSPYTLIEKPEKSVLLIGQDVPELIVDSLAKAYDLELLQQQKNSKFRVVGKDQEATLGQLDYQIDTAFVFGYFPQLNPAHYRIRKDLQTIEDLSIDFPCSIALGDSLPISIENLSGVDTEIYTVLGNDTLTKIIASGAQEDISILPKASGYVLASVFNDRSNYHFAIQVEEAPHYVVQILSATPDFEWKFLGDYLKFEGHSVYQRTQISKDKFKSSFLNWPDSLPINRGVAKDLKVLFVDAKAWEEITPNKRDQYLDKLKENDGSLIFRTNPNSQIRLDLDKANSTNIFSTSDNLLESKKYNYLQFSNLYLLDEVVENAVFRKVNPRMVYGIINFQNSYPLKLSGKNREYEQVWEPVFNQLIRNSTKFFHDKSEWSIQYQPFFFRLWSDEKVKEISIFNLKNDTIKLKAKSDYIFPERHHFMFYPQEMGWHFITFKDQTESIPFYVHSSSSADQSEFLNIYNHDYLNYLNFDDSRVRRNQKDYQQKHVTMWFFLLFLLSAGYLWIEDKIT